ncbi:hypothetical protein QJS04_geneDACA004756 [Acorus gramineus]|uniref:Uncharacterized protein n=1 Tax=Acorus gramineus TaxID=55184 RepID=A0AAV9BTQ8_ACOGR|nr:hypothetical protein QJS04_geneDACA004756 [Acorus gramineus]
MKKRGFKLLWVVSCACEKSVRTKSYKDIEEILKSGLAPIIEEEEDGDEEGKEEVEELCPPEDKKPVKKCYVTRSAKRITKVKFGHLFKHRFTSIGDCYVHCMISFASRGNMRGLARF